MQIYTYGDDILRSKAESVADIDGYMDQLTAEMLESMRDGKGIGLAGPQVGVLKRVFVAQIPGDIPRVFINPKIVETSPDEVEIEEGCLSIPGIYTNIIRPSMVKVDAYDEKGKPFSLDADGLLARVILHEYDHLDGILFIDRVGQRRRERIIKMYERKVRA